MSTITDYLTKLKYEQSNTLCYIEEQLLRQDDFGDLFRYLFVDNNMLALVDECQWVYSPDGVENLIRSMASYSDCNLFFVHIGSDYDLIFLNQCDQDTDSVLEYFKTASWGRAKNIYDSYCKLHAFMCRVAEKTGREPKKCPLCAENIVIHNDIQRFLSIAKKEVK